VIKKTGAGVPSDARCGNPEFYRRLDICIKNNEVECDRQLQHSQIPAILPAAYIQWLAFLQLYLMKPIEMNLRLKAKYAKFQQFCSAGVVLRSAEPLFFNGEDLNCTRRRGRRVILRLRKWVQARRLNGVQGGEVGVGVIFATSGAWSAINGICQCRGWCYLSGNAAESNQANSQPTCAPTTNDLNPEAGDQLDLSPKLLKVARFCSGGCVRCRMFWQTLLMIPAFAPDCGWVTPVSFH